MDHRDHHLLYQRNTPTSTSTSTPSHTPSPHLPISTSTVSTSSFTYPVPVLHPELPPTTTSPLDLPLPLSSSSLPTPQVQVPLTAQAPAVYSGFDLDLDLSSPDPSEDRRGDSLTSFTGDGLPVPNASDIVGGVGASGISKSIPMERSQARVRAATALRALKRQARVLAEADAPIKSSGGSVGSSGRGGAKATVKTKAVRSAFVSRQRGRHYAALLAEHVCRIECERDAAAANNRSLTAEIAHLRACLQTHTAARTHSPSHPPTHSHSQRHHHHQQPEAAMAAAAFTHVLDGVIEAVARDAGR